MENLFGTNRIQLVGIVEDAPVFSHYAFGEKLFRMLVSAERKSGYKDISEVIVREKTTDISRLLRGTPISIDGQIRTYNKISNGKNKLCIFLFARQVLLLEKSYIEQFNKVYLDGYICKKPACRVSPLGREISDIMLAVNRQYGKSDYIPCIAWGKNAEYTTSLEVGKKLKIEGRLQSRIYKKINEIGESEEKMAFEVSVLRIVL